MGLVSLPDFMNSFCRKIFLLYSINCQSFIILLSLLREILGDIHEYVQNVDQMMNSR